MMRLNPVLLLLLLVLWTPIIGFSSQGIKFPSQHSSLHSPSSYFPAPSNKIQEDIPSSIRIITRGGHLPSFNPFIDLTFIYPFMSLVYDPLINIDPETGEYIPALVKQWVVTNDSKEWTLYLRDDVVFHNGFPFNASVVHETFERLLLPLPPESILSEAAFTKIESCEVLEEFIVRIRMKEPGSPFDRDFPCIAWDINREATYLVNATEGFTPRGGGMIWPIGTGPYRLESLTNGTNYYNFTFTRFEDHFRGLAPFQTIYCIFYPQIYNYNDAIMAQTGELAERYIPSSFIDDQYWVRAPRSPYTLIGQFNSQREELSNPLVRLALNYAIDRQALIQQIEGWNNRDFLEYDVHPAMIALPRVLESSNLNFGYPTDITLSETLLNEAGYPRDSDGYRFNLTISSPSYQVYVQNFLCSAFESLGIRCTLIMQDHWSYSFDNTTDIFTFDTYLGLNYYDLLHSNGKYNFGGFSNQTMDNVTFRDKQTPVRQEKEYYQQLICQLSQELAPFLLLLNGRLGYIKARSISSLIHHSPYGFYLFNYSSPGRFQSSFSVNQVNNSLISSQSRNMDSILVGTQNLYFPFTDNMLQAEQPLTVSTQESLNLHSILPDYNQEGKFFKITVSNQTIKYYLRCYYDFEDIISLSINNSNQLTLYSWDSISESWQELIPISRNINLRYVEILIQGDVIVRFGFLITLSAVTFRFLPIVSIFIISMVAIIGITMINNQRATKYLLMRYES